MKSIKNERIIVSFVQFTQCFCLFNLILIMILQVGIIFFLFSQKFRYVQLVMELWFDFRFSGFGLCVFVLCYFVFLVRIGRWINRIVRWLLMREKLGRVYFVMFQIILWKCGFERVIGWFCCSYGLIYFSDSVCKEQYQF